MAEAQPTVPPSPSVPFPQGDVELSPTAGPDFMQSFEAFLNAGPDLPEETATEGRVHNPVASQGPEKRSGYAGGNGSNVYVAVPDLQDLDNAVESTHSGASQSTAQKSREEALTTEECDAGPGHRRFESMMQDLTELIETLPVGYNADELQPALAPSALEPSSALEAHANADYDMSGRPTSRWRCRRELFKLEEGTRGHVRDVRVPAPSAPSDSGSKIRQPQPPDTRSPYSRTLDFRNPYIRALDTTREELDRSFDLVSKASPASLLATRRYDALASMQVTEVDEYDQCGGGGGARHLCLSEPCREPCRQDPNSQVYEVQISHPDFDHILQRRYNDDPNYLGTAFGPSPTSDEDLIGTIMQRDDFSSNERTPFEEI